MSDLQAQPQNKRVLENACPIENNHANNESSNTANKKKRGRRKTRNERFKEKHKKVRVDYAPIVKENQALVTYYRQQNLVKDDEFDTVFLEGLRSTLPASFRINTFDLAQAVFLRSHIQGPIASRLREYVTSNEEKVSGDEKSSESVQNSTLAVPASIDPLVWYPKNLAWQLNITRIDLRKIPFMQHFHQFLMAETDSGFISRQESVSMIPPLLLDIKKGHNILDVCAAPGSKTAQLLEYLRSGMLSHDGKPIFRGQCYDKGIDDGMVVANDVDNKRCYMLVHQSSRLNSPNCVIINEDASKFESLKQTDENGVVSDLKFDRILCDVPCSGDGTIRKNPDVWKKWTIGNGNNFHGLQSKILRRSLQLLKKDGLLVYSTCSMNPIEDEAVIASILRTSNGGVVLESAAVKLPGLKYSAGLTSWVVMDKEMNVISSFDQVPNEKASYTYPSLFPPKQEEIEKFNLNRCIRVLPHLQNTGGFFVALLRKVVDKLPDEKDKTVADANVDAKELPKRDKKKRYGGFKEDPFAFIDQEDKDWKSIKNSFGFSDDFPVDQLVHRCVSGNKRSIYLVSKNCRNFIMSNQEAEGRKEFVKIINAGIRLFTRSTIDAGFRVCQDGINEVFPYIKDDLKITLEKDDLVSLIKFRHVRLETFSEDLKTRINNSLKLGSFVLLYKHNFVDYVEDKIKSELPLVAWKGEVSVSLYVSDKFRVHLAAITETDLSETCIKDKKF